MGDSAGVLARRKIVKWDWTSGWEALANGSSTSGLFDLLAQHIEPKHRYLQDICRSVSRLF